MGTDVLLNKDTYDNVHNLCLKKNNFGSRLEDPSNL